MITSLKIRVLQLQHNAASIMRARPGAHPGADARGHTRATPNTSNPRLPSDRLPHACPSPEDVSGRCWCAVWGEVCE